MRRHLPAPILWLVPILALVVGCSLFSDDPVPELPELPEPEGRFCESDEEGFIRCREGGGDCLLVGEEGEATCEGEIPCQLGQDASLICFQDTGQTEDRPPEATPPQEGLVTTTVEACSIAAQVGIKVFNGRTSGGVGWAVPQTGAAPPVTEVLLRDGQKAIGTVSVKAARTGMYPGRLRFQWSLDGSPVPLTRPDGSAFAPSFRLRGKKPDTFGDALQAREKRYEKDGIAFRLRKPPRLGRVRPILEQDVRVQVAWDPDAGPPCIFTVRFRLRWISGLSDPGGFRLPGKPGRVEANTPVVGTPRLNAIDGVPFYLVPLSYPWKIDRKERCCGIADCNFEVIQFARAAVETTDPRGDRGKPYSLDVSQGEKDRANSGREYDPTFTAKPRSTNRDRTRPVGSGGNQALQQVDGPGMTRFRYDQLSSGTVESIFRQQFLAFLVCQAKERRSRPVHTAAAYLNQAKVVEAVLYTVSWKFPGRDPSSGLPRPPNVTAEVNARIDTRQGQFAYLRCKQTLDLFLAGNGLLDAYRRPGPAELRPMTPMDNNRLNASIRGANSISVPTPAEVANR